MWCLRHVWGFPFILSVGLCLACEKASHARDLDNSRDNRIADWTSTALSADLEKADDAIAGLRALGADGLTALMAAHADEIARIQTSLDADRVVTDTKQVRLLKAIDRVAGQKDALYSRLYWYTDIEAAKRDADVHDRPILSLRLLGRLDEELSCANSRLFRTALYANHEVAEYLRDHFTLHWESIRPVPKITIEFGDGRTICSTLTGNSIHYVLDVHGRPIDAVPGLYNPAAFIRVLRRVSEPAEQLGEMNGKQRVEFLAKFHTERLERLRQQWQVDLFRVKGIALQSPETPGGTIETRRGLPLIEVAENGALANKPIQPAVAAQQLTVGKLVVEMPVLANLLPVASSQVAASGNVSEITENANRNAPRAQAEPRASSLVQGSGEERMLVDILPLLRALEDATDDRAWSAMSRRYFAESTLDAGSRKLFRHKHRDVSRLVNGAADGAEVTAAIQVFERNMAEDTLRNEYRLHRHIHEWFARSSPETAEVSRLNSRVYDELFLSPESDPWMGLLRSEVYSALPAGGATESFGNAQSATLAGESSRSHR